MTRTARISTGGCYRPRHVQKDLSVPARSTSGPPTRHRSHSTPAQAAAGDTASVRRIVARLERMPVEQARLVASAAYTLARAAQADLEISDEETAVIELELRAHEAIDEATAVLVTEMAKLQARTVGGTEDYVVTREFAALASEAAADRRAAGVLRGRPRRAARSRPRRPR